jgi:GT2 family glycosyltransferase
MNDAVKVNWGNIHTIDGSLTDDGPLNDARISAEVSIIIVCYGQLEYTKLCIASLLKHTRGAYELIFVDGESMDGTADYLAGVETAALNRVKVVSGRGDIGYFAACDLAIAEASGRFIVLLNNDTIVTSGWLNQLIALVSSNAAIGGAGPMSNHASCHQRIDSVPYRLRRLGREDNGRDLAVQDWCLFASAITAFAAQWRQENLGKWFETDTLDLFCLLLKREVVDAIRPLGGIVSQCGRPSNLSLDQEQFGSRIRSTGFRLACCRDLFIHHFGSRIPISSGGK